MGNNNNLVQFETSNYSKAFLSALTLLGVYASAKLLSKTAKFIQKSQYRSLTWTQFKKRYGENTWAVIMDARANMGYCEYLANMGVNLILCGDPSQEQSLNRARQNLRFIFSQIQIITIFFSQNDRDSTEFYEKIFKDKAEEVDISFLVLPDSSEIPQIMLGHQQQIEPFIHYYTLLRGFSELFATRANKNLKSAIILPSSKQIDKIVKNRGVDIGRRSGLDALVRSISYEEGDKIDFICSRGKVGKCFRMLGKQLISE